MANNTAGQENNKDLKYTAHVDQEEVRRELDRLLNEKLSRVSEKIDPESFEGKFREKSQELEQAKEDHYRRKAGGLRPRRNPADDGASSGGGEHARIYAAASAAIKKLGSYRPVGEGAVHRTWRLIKTLVRRRRDMAGKPWYTQERRDAVYAAAMEDCWAPAVGAWEELWANSWNFLSTAASDLWDLVLIAVDFVIAAAYYAGSFFYYVWDRLWDVRYWLEQHRKNLFTGFAMFVVVAAGSVVFINSVTAYEYSYHGRYLGTARSVDDVYRTIDVVGDKLSIAAGVNVSLDVERDMAFKKVVGFNMEVDSDEDILNTITYMKDLQVEAYALYIDGAETIILESETAAKALLDSVRNRYVKGAEGVEYTDISYEQDVNIKAVFCLLGDIWNMSDAQSYLFGEDSDSPRLTVKSTETATYTEAVLYDVQYIDNASLYEGETEVKTPGQEGVDLVVATVERVNGEEVARRIVSTTRVTEPVPEVQYRGTKPIPAAEGTGEFNYPMNTYTISSYFGMRWGRLHTGVDLAAPIGTKIYASDGGTVTFAGWKGSYGYLVIISHGGLLESYYAHCSRLLVSAGDKVYQGQNIALVGNTGNSTGSHCHFEIRYNGEPGNPLDYL